MNIRGIEFTSDVRYIYAVGKVRGLERYMFDRKILTRMADMSYDEIIKMLPEYEYTVSSEADIYDYESILNDELMRQYQLIRFLVGEGDRHLSVNFDNTDTFNLTSALYLKYDFYNFKLAAKQKILGDTYITESLRPNYSQSGLISSEEIRSVFRDEYYTRYGIRFARTVEDIFTAYDITKDASVIENRFDRLLYTVLREIVTHHNNGFLMYYYRCFFDFYNLKNLYRFQLLHRDMELYRDSYLSGGAVSLTALLNVYNQGPEEVAAAFGYTDYATVLQEGVAQLEATGSLAPMERMMDNFLIDWLKSARLNSFGIEPLLGYVYGKEYEVINLRRILVGRLNNLDGRQIMEGMRISYV